MIDPASGWFEVREIDTKHPCNVAKAVELANIITYDKGTEFQADRYM
jgi:hypothetical protein